MTTPLNRQIGARIRTRRESLGMTQDQLAKKMGLNHRQTLGAIESGERNTQPAELVAVARALQVPLDYFTDRYSAGGEAAFSFRAESAQEPELSQVEEQAGRWLATYRELAEPSLLKHALSLTVSSSFELAQSAGEQTRRDLGLGRFPAHELEEAIERVWGILVLYVDFPDGVSGAASRLEGVQAILINRREPKGRRHYDLAHELFHLLTWDTMPPARIDSAASLRGEKKRVEQLANNFAAALLMPRDSILGSWQEHEELRLIERIAVMAAEFGVSGPALKWRLFNISLVSEHQIPEDSDISRGVAERAEVMPPLFNVTFVNRLHRAVEEGALSVRKAARILGTDTVGLAELCRSYGRPLSYEI